MMSNKFKIQGLTFVLAFVAVFFTQCKSPTENIVVTATADFVSTGKYVYLTDASTGEPLSKSTNAIITVKGKDANLVYSTGGKTKLVVADGGIIQFAYRRGAMASVDKPLAFDLVVEIPGFRTEVIPIKSYHLGYDAINVSLVNLSALPKGLALLNSDINTDANGVATTEKTFNISVSATANYDASLQIPAGTKMFDDKGNAVTGKLDVRIIQTASVSNEAVKTYGDVLNVAVYKPNGASLGSGVLLPAGSLDIQIKSAAGNKVKSFSQPINARMDLNKDLINLYTGNVIKEGDSLAILSINDGESARVFEGTSLVFKDGITGKLYTTFPIFHLSGFDVALAPSDLGDGIGEPIGGVGAPGFFGQPIGGGATGGGGGGAGGGGGGIGGLLGAASGAAIGYAVGNDNTFDNNYSSNSIEALEAATKNICGITVPVAMTLSTTTINGNKDSMIDSRFTGVVEGCKYRVVSSGATGTQLIYVQFRGRCTNGNADYVTLPNFTQLWYKAGNHTGSEIPEGPTWSYGYVTNSSGSNNFNLVSLRKDRVPLNADVTYAILHDGVWYKKVFQRTSESDDQKIELDIPCE